MVGMPRRSTEWSTESSCTRVARWISSTMAASVTARGSSAPLARCDSSSSVGRNSFPFMCSRCSFTSVMTGKSAATMRRSSAATPSSSAATGRWMSRSDTRAICWLTLLRLPERLDAVGHVAEADVHREHPPVQLARLGALAEPLERAAEPIEHAQSIVVPRGGQVEPAPQDRLGDHVRALFHEARPQRLRRLELPLGRPQRLLQLRDRLVEQPHLLEGDSQVVVRLEVRLVDVLLDALAEAGEHPLEVALLVARRLLVLDLHARVALDVHLLEDHRARSEEHTSELQSLAYLVCRLLLEKKKTLILSYFKL